mmetsp:Transcript_34256/g.101815  ORF Transcript_34256/g.101815 Transcript_34256/m.101815 type:complete len:233 (+) Transcript_34256:405-1103(+)
MPRPRAVRLACALVQQGTRTLVHVFLHANTQLKKHACTPQSKTTPIRDTSGERAIHKFEAQLGQMLLGDPLLQPFAKVRRGSAGAAAHPDPRASAMVQQLHTLCTGNHALGNGLLLYRCRSHSLGQFWGMGFQLLHYLGCLSAYAATPPTATAVAKTANAVVGETPAVSHMLANQLLPGPCTCVVGAAALVVDAPAEQFIVSSGWQMFSCTIPASSSPLRSASAHVGAASSL